MHGLTRRRSAVVVSYQTAAAIVEKSDLIAVVPEYIARQYRVEYVDLPLEISPMAIYLIWHERIHCHPAQRWFRTLLSNLLKQTFLPVKNPTLHRETLGGPGP